MARISSGLGMRAWGGQVTGPAAGGAANPPASGDSASAARPARSDLPARRHQGAQTRLIRQARRCSGRWRSEEHTSELQSQSNLVCRLLLEKKKKKQLSSRRDVMMDVRSESA